MTLGRCIGSAILLGLLLVVTARAQNPKLDWCSFNMGYGDLSAGNTAVTSVVGQDFAGMSWQSNTQVIGGFLACTLSGTMVVAVSAAGDVPTVYSLGQNYPNPFNPSTTIHFEMPVGGHVTLKVYNVLGQEVLTLLDEEKVAGRYDVRMGASALPSGAYFYRLQAGEPPAGGGQAFVQTRKCLLIR